MNATIGDAIKGKILTMAASTGSQVLGVSDIEPVVAEQQNALPGSATGSTGSSGSSSSAAIGGAVGGVVVIAVIIAVVVMMRRKQSGVAMARAGAQGAPRDSEDAPPMGGSSFYPPPQGAGAPPMAPSPGMPPSQMPPSQPALSLSSRTWLPVSPRKRSLSGRESDPVGPQP